MLRIYTLPRNTHCHATYPTVEYAMQHTHPYYTIYITTQHTLHINSALRHSTHYYALHDTMKYTLLHTTQYYTLLNTM